MKLKKKSGFTLIEMLIVVAIIAVLVAVSIPMVTNALERARVSTDAANERAAKAEALLCFVNGTTDGSTVVTATNKFEVGDAYAYDAALGKLRPVSESNSIKPYGKCIDNHESMGTTECGPHTNQIIYVQVDENGTVYLRWNGCDTNVTTAKGFENTCHGTTVDA